MFFFIIIVTTQRNIQSNFNSIQSNFNPGWGYKVIGLKHHPPPTTSTQTGTFKQILGNLEQQNLVYKLN